MQGFGTLLMEEAERIAREEHGSVKLAVISGKCLIDDQRLRVDFDPDFVSGVGTRDYYRRLGYALEGPYMTKSLL